MIKLKIFPKRMRYLLIPGNNSLSHVAKCLAIREVLLGKGHETLIAVNQKHAQFLKKIEMDHYVLPDIQEIDMSPFPTTAWFKQPMRIIDCIKKEAALLESYKPNRVLGVFRFTSKASAQLTGIPYDSLICGCMLPQSTEVLGFSENEAGIKIQIENLKGFYQYAGTKMSIALASLGLSKISDIRCMLKGDRTFLWDFPEFLPVEKEISIIHVGPIKWNRWPHDPIDINKLFNGTRPLAILTFGTCTISILIAKRIITLLLELGYNVLIAAGGQEELLTIMPDEPRVTALNFAPLQNLFPHSAMVVCHGGQMTVFDALYNKIPVVVMPFQPEQAHNGVCLERIGCGCRLVPPQPFRQNPWVFIDALNRMSDYEIKSKVTNLVNNPQTAIRLAEVKEVLDRYNGPKALAAMLEVG
jgi:UDP:flavonoid glycosyltransferase YjiC (YdhE family)